MYCIKCGKPTESGVLCADCQQKLAEQTVCTTDNVDAEVIPAEQPVVVVEKTMRVVSEADLEENQKKACKNQLSSAIVAFVFSILAFVPIVGILCAIAAMAIGVPTLVKYYIAKGHKRLTKEATIALCYFALILADIAYVVNVYVYTY